jgi:hypothetical protein
VTARFETLCFGYGLVEGPRACADGSVVFSDALGGGNAEDAARGGTFFRTRVDTAGLVAPPARV